ncbi:MAG: hypothetical protein DRJ63_07965 [Thermoprotei archaeon]|nr:MAG: hypothetical protein DRJ63_07965 [Thermoprotei archaeon]
MGAVVKIVKCPKCKTEILIDQNELELAASKAKRGAGLYSLAFDHEDHVVIIYIDETGNIRGVEASPLLRSEVPLFVKIDIVPIPKPREKMPSLKRLSREELAVLCHCDGSTSLREISEALGIPYGRVKAIVETLYGAGYISKLKEVVLE